MNSCRGRGCSVINTNQGKSPLIEEPESSSRELLGPPAGARPTGPALQFSNTAAQSSDSPAGSCKAFLEPQWPLHPSPAFPWTMAPGDKCPPLHLHGAAPQPPASRHSHSHTAPHTTSLHALGTIITSFSTKKPKALLQDHSLRSDLNPNPGPRSPDSPAGVGYPNPALLPVFARGWLFLGRLQPHPHSEGHARETVCPWSRTYSTSGPFHEVHSPHSRQLTPYPAHPIQCFWTLPNPACPLTPRKRREKKKKRQKFYLNIILLMKQRANQFLCGFFCSQKLPRCQPCTR